ncbi:(2Fe-2S)-binding protein [Amycolatopsis carbonis]|uniref:(2Fe-2S)-binding protein n=1 Tax=Amycolatopsis carbonis TaxID=715471 RepID=A0A9Y2INT2_9PSEU|nr:(2Fe-2S)-binding protein [Amycolatopsis sp. 2-15]WIX83527.1 (2Fe-2S)-binding protein [Amycolatopsis sp. 2-15]
MNPFFAFDTHAAGDQPAASWRPLAEVLDDGPVLRERVAQVRAVLAAGGGEVELRVAASVTHLGIAARLLSPALALAVGDGVVPDFSDAWWQPTIGGAVPLSLPETQPVDDDPVALFDRRVLRGPLSRLDTALAQFSLSETIRRGNVASALNGAVTMLRQERPEWTDEINRFRDSLEALPALADTATREDGRFRRRSCCLIYRAAPRHDGPKCGDCVLA